MGGYDLSPKDMAKSLKEWAQDGLVNAIGGCCGTTPDHIKAFAEAVKGMVPARKIPDHPNHMRLCGLEPFEINPSSMFANIGERCNVAGSIRFKKLIVANDWGKAAEIAQNQVESGAQLLDGTPPSNTHTSLVFVLPCILLTLFCLTHRLACAHVFVHKFRALFFAFSLIPVRGNDAVCR